MVYGSGSRLLLEKSEQDYASHTIHPARDAQGELTQTKRRNDPPLVSRSALLIKEKEAEHKKRKIRSLREKKE
jgi:hypothetical protein